MFQILSKTTVVGEKQQSLACVIETALFDLHQQRNTRGCFGGTHHRDQMRQAHSPEMRKECLAAFGIMVRHQDASFLIVEPELRWRRLLELCHRHVGVEPAYYASHTRDTFWSLILTTEVGVTVVAGDVMTTPSTETSPWRRTGAPPSTHNANGHARVSRTSLVPWRWRRGEGRHPFDQSLPFAPRTETTARDALRQPFHQALTTSGCHTRRRRQR